MPKGLDDEGITIESTGSRAAGEAPPAYREAQAAIVGQRADLLGSIMETGGKSAGAGGAGHVAVAARFRSVSSPPDALEDGAPVKFGLETAKAFESKSAASAPLTFPPCPLVSVIIPTYNRSSLVTRAVRSVLAQTMENFEILVVDDASTDDTPQAIASISDPRLRYLRQPVNRDVSAARNRGLREARGEFIAFLDSDDEWLPRKLELQLEVFRGSPELVGLVYAGSQMVKDGGVRTEFRASVGGYVFNDLLLKNITYSGSASVMIRRNVVRTIGFYDEEIAAMEDYDYWIRTGRFYAFGFVEEPLVRYHDLQREDRRSLVKEDDILARDRLYAKYRNSLRRADLEDRFLVASALRRLERLYPPDPRGALKTAFQALRAKPRSREARALVLRILRERAFPSVASRIARRVLPARLRLKLRAIAARLPSLASAKR